MGWIPPDNPQRPSWMSEEQWHRRLEYERKCMEEHERRTREVNRDNVVWAVTLTGLLIAVVYMLGSI